MGSSLINKFILLSIISLIGVSNSFATTEQPLPNQPKASAEEVFYPKYPATKPAPGVNPELIARGEYLSKVGDCISCHTNVKAGTPSYAGGLPIATPFGTFYSPNITPDKDTGIGNWSEQDFIRALKEGRDPHGRNYFPVFPYVYFAKTTDEDVKALYAYFMSIPAVNQKNKPLPFPFNVPGARISLWGWNFLFFFPNNTPFANDPKQSPEWNRGKYLIDGLGHCSMCHTPLNIFGSPKNRYYLTGGFINGYWAPNITKLGLEAASVQQVADVFGKAQLINNAGPVEGPMAEVYHNSTRYLTPEDHIAMATYLKAVDVPDPLGVESPSNNPPSIARGREVYVKACVICHQNGEMAAPLIGSSASWYLRLQSSGLEGLYKHVINGFNSMPVKGACVRCSDNDVKSAVDYILDESLTRAQWLDLKAENKADVPKDEE